MITRPRTHLWVPLLALGLAFGTVAPTPAQSATSGSITINFGSTPRWSNVSGTSVRRIHEDDRSDYDIFRVGRKYYAYNYANHRWYVSSRWRDRGNFTLIANRRVPRELRRLPRENWRHYPNEWDDNARRGSNDSYGTLMVSFGSSPSWTSIGGTRVEAVYGSDRPNYDVFRYGGTYYAYSNDRWYSSSRESGRFVVIEERSVPSEISWVPREQWRRYPANWRAQNADRQGRNNGNNGRGRGPGDRDDRRGRGRGGN